jgi:cold shock CspA family protein/ribosome-associated translation inhibitor RaiA
MQIPLHLSCSGVELMPDQEALIRATVAKLERFFDRLVACRVTVSVSNRYPGGEPVAWAFRIALTVPGDELAVTRQAKPTFREALDDAFDAARRRLQDFARELRGDVRLPDNAPKGQVTRLFSYEGYGFITAQDGHEVYFHGNSVPDKGFDRLTTGTFVRYVESEGERGPQASTVMPLAHPSPAASGPERG